MRKREFFWRIAAGKAKGWLQSLSFFCFGRYAPTCYPVSSVSEEYGVNVLSPGRPVSSSILS
jgi:hypothetical protein